MRDTTRGILIGAALAGVLAAGGLLAWREGQRRGVTLTDAGRISVPASDARVREVLWEPADLLPDWINQGRENYEPRLSGDGRTLLFVRGKAGGGADLYAAERGDVAGQGAWGEAFPLEGVNTPDADELGGVLSADGRTLYFYSDRAGGLGGYDLWMSRRLTGGEASDGAPSVRPEDGASEQDAREHAGVTSVLPIATTLRGATWSPAENLGPAVNSPFNDYGPAPMPDGSAIYFSSNRPTPDEPVEEAGRSWPATVREDQTRRDYDLYVAPMTERGLGEAARVEALSTPFNDGTPAVSPPGDFLYFASDKPGGAGGLDIYRVRLRGDEAAAAENLGWPINTPANELDPALSMGGFALHFSSDRQGRTAGDDSGAAIGSEAGDRGYAIHSTISREVYRVRTPLLARVDWWGLWSALWPWLLLLALLGALLALLRRFLRDEGWQQRWRRLSLLAKCVVLSLMLHALLAALFTVWYVSGSVGDLLRRSGGTRVALVSRGVGSDLASQIRGGLTDFAVRPESVEQIRASLSVERKAEMTPAEFETERTDSADQRLDTPEPPSEARPEDAAAPSPRPEELARRLESSTPAAVATPEAIAAQARAEAAIEARLESAPATAAPVPVSSRQVAARLEVARASTPDRAMASSERAADAAAPAPTPGEVAPIGDLVVEASPGAAQNVRTPEVPGGRRSTEEAVRIDAESRALAPSGAAPVLPESRSSSPMARLAPESGARPEADVGLAASVPSDHLLEARASLPLTPTASVPDLPAPSAGVQGALPTSRAAAADEASIDAADAAGVRGTPVHRAEAPLLTPRADAPGAAVLAPEIGTSSPPDRPMVDAGGTEPAPMQRVPALGPPPAPVGVAIELDPIRSGLALPQADTAARSAPSEQHATATARSASGPTRPDEVGIPVLDARAAQTSFEPAATPGNAEADASLAADSTPAVQSSHAAPSPGFGSAVPETLPPSLGTLPTPTIALPTFVEEPPPPSEPLGEMSGVVTDAETGRPISGARIRLDLPDAPALVVRSNVRGEYTLDVPAGIPDNVAISVIAPGYTPTSINVAASQIERAHARGGPLERDFALTPLDWAVVPIEEDPEVHHLGNDEFEGAINSQFQRSSEGLVYAAEFTLAADQVGRAIRAAELVVLAKGAQANNPIRINGRELEQYIVGTPRDGSFGELTFRINPRWLVEGVNTIEIRSVRGSNDLDDFEFVNPRIRLRPTGATQARP